jgi:undecaprenyl-diphosphatase
LLEYLQAVVYGIVQGLTEFLPISSTAHLRLIPLIFGWSDPGAAYSAVIQLGTVLAVIAYFRKDVFDLAAAFFRGIAARDPFSPGNSRTAWFILFGTLPIGVCGVVFKKFIVGEARGLKVVLASMLVFGVLLLIAEIVARRRRGMDSLGWADSQMIGAAQALALIPGASRSGVTITAGLLLGLDREAAARFSFLLSIPAVTAAGLFEMKDLIGHGTREAGLFPLALATLVSFAAGYGCIAFLLAFLRTRSTYVFSIYRMALASAALAVLW